MLKFKICSTGSYLPNKIVKNADLPAELETSDEWIVSRTGIRQRHIAAPDESSSTMAAQALSQALERAGLKAQDLDGIIVATTTPDLYFPSTAALVQQALNSGQGFAFDIQAVCSGFVYALQIAASMLNGSGYRRIAVIGADTMSRILDWQDRSSCVLFGDGAGAVIIEQTQDEIGLLSYNINCDGRLRDILCTSGGVAHGDRNCFLEMKGREVYKQAIDLMSESLARAIDEAGVDAIDYLVPHQANQRIIDQVAAKFEMAPHKIISTIALHANTSAASIPLGLDHTFAGNPPADKVLAITAAGAGFTWGSSIIKT